MQYRFIARGSGEAGRRCTRLDTRCTRASWLSTKEIRFTARHRFARSSRPRTWLFCPPVKLPECHGFASTEATTDSIRSTSLSLSSSHVIKPLTCSRFSKLKQENGAGCLSRERERELGNLGKIEFRAIFDIQLMVFFHVLLRFLFYFIASLIFPQFLQTLNNFQNDKNVCVFFLTN